MEKKNEWFGEILVRKSVSSTLFHYDGFYSKKHKDGGGLEWI